MQPVTVEFLIADIVHPEPSQVLVELYEKKLLRGEVIAVTDDGQKPKSLLVIKVPGLNEPVIVPAASTCPQETLPGWFVADDGSNDEELLILGGGTYQKAKSPRLE
jgi:hypothetical protein